MPTSVLDTARARIQLNTNGRPVVCHSCVLCQCFHTEPATRYVESDYAARRRHPTQGNRAAHAANHPHRHASSRSSRDTASRIRDHTPARTVRPRSNATVFTIDGHPTTPRVVPGIVPRHLESHQGPFCITTYKVQSKATLLHTYCHPTTPRVVSGIVPRHRESHQGPYYSTHRQTAAQRDIARL